LVSVARRFMLRGKILSQPLLGFRALLSRKSGPDALVAVFDKPRRRSALLDSQP
jgi:hypothetical protein